MDESNLPYLMGIQFSVLICLIMAGGLWFAFRELRKTRKNAMKLKRELAQVQRRLKAEEQGLSGSEAIPPLQFLQQSIDQTKAEFSDVHKGENIDDIGAQDSEEKLTLSIRYHLLTAERALRADGDETFSVESLIEGLKGKFNDLKQTRTVTEPTENTEENVGSEQVSDHYKGLYDDLLVTLQRSKETIRSLALRLSDIIDEGMDEEQLNALVEDLNNSMDAFGELSGISSSSGNQQMEDEVKEIRRAYEMGMNLMEHFENAIKQTADIKEAVTEHSSVVETNRNNYEEGETVDREAILTNNKRYSRLLDDSQLLIDALTKEIESGKDIIGDFLSMTRKFQDQSTRIAILQAREKQLNSDLKQAKLSKDETKESIIVRDIQLGALHKKFVENNDNDSIEKICTFAGEIYRIQKEIDQLDENDKTSAIKNKRKELIQKRLGVEAQIKELVGN